MYTIGLDFGTLSCRGVLADVSNGEELYETEMAYSHKVIDTCFLDGSRLPDGWALQDPHDYMETMLTILRRISQSSGVRKEQIVGIGIDFTACTLLPVKEDGTPLCYDSAFVNRPHAYVKLWKHHAAQPMADRINALAAERREPWLPRYGGKISSEWAFPKILQVVEEDKEVYEKSAYFVEAADWIVWQLCGHLTRNACTAGYKAMWNEQDGFPSGDFFEALHPAMKNVISDKFGGPIVAAGECAGYLRKELAELVGLCEQTAIATANVDAHVTMPAAKISEPKKMLAIMGTSTCHMLMSDKIVEAEGICGVVYGGILPDMYGYEAGQSGVGDAFAWFMNNAVPISYGKEAEARNISLYTLLDEKVQRLKPGENRMLSLDWLNGNRSILSDSDVSGMLIGITLQTKPEDIYRSLIEATAFGTRVIIDNFRRNGIEVDAFVAAGGLAHKSPVIMQIYADILQLPIQIAKSRQGPALGSAIFASVAAGKKSGGYDTIQEAANHMGKLDEMVYTPNTENAKIYDKLYEEYVTLYDYFGRNRKDIMRKLKHEYV